MPSFVCDEVSAWRSMTVTFIGFSPYSRGKTGIGGEWVVDEDLAHEAIRQVVWQCIAAIEVPVRVVGGEQQHLVRADLLDESLQLIGARRCIERLDGQAHMLTRISRRSLFEPRHLGPNAAPGLVGAPHP